MLWSSIVSILSSALRMGLPLAFAALGGVYSSKAGITALGLEGMMLSGSFAAAYFSFATGNPWLGLLGSAVAGGLLALLEAWLIVKQKVDQVIGGIGINLLALGGTNLLLQVVWNNRGKSASLPTLPSIHIPGFGAISVLLFLLLAVVGFSVWLLRRTRFGLRLRAVGENPIATRSIGVNNSAIKLIAMLVCGMLAGIAGAYLSIDNLNVFSRNITAGRGYIAMSIIILANYHPGGVLWGSLLFGFADALQILLQRTGTSGQLLKAVPYLLTLLVITIADERVRAPQFLGINSNEE